MAAMLGYSLRVYCISLVGSRAETEYDGGQFVASMLD